MHGEETLRSFLLDAGLVSRSQLDAAHAKAQAEGETLSKTLVSSGFISEDELRRVSAAALGVPFVILKNEDISADALHYIPEPLARAHQVVAYAANDGGVEVALLSMDDLAAIEHLRGKIKIKPRLTTRDSIKRGLLLYQKKLKERFGERIRNETKPALALEALISHALSAGASDVQLEPHQSGEGAPETLVRYRIEGEMHDAMTLPSVRAAVSHLKEVCNLSHTLMAPQESRCALEVGGEKIVVRVSTLPTLLGEKVSLRLIRGGDRQKGFTLESLGFHGGSLDMLHHALCQPTGLILVSGLQHSGKTTLLYTLLDILASPRRSLATIEKNIEFRLPYATQTQAHHELGLTLGAGLRALLRHDPDVVMISDIEDDEVAALAQSAARRMLVLAAAEEPSAAANPAAAIALRLLPRLCPHCKQAYRLTRADLDVLEGGAQVARVLGALREEGIVDKQRAWKEVTFYAAAGCAQCEGGYKGELGVQAVKTPAGESLTLVEDAIFKAAQGLLAIPSVLKLAQRE